MRDRDSLAQERLPIGGVRAWLDDALEQDWSPPAVGLTAAGCGSAAATKTVTVTQTQTLTTTQTVTTTGSVAVSEAVRRESTSQPRSP